MSFKEIIQNIEDQKLKAIVLKIKNEGMKRNYFLGVVTLLGSAS